ncbi:uncharacterized protein BT62DRAFT_542723 [Guyanagaster necrorhizus]|uniref:Uncharacterized protein n=1 Tax=Guyanagaster necrorhizus TaxID=856835 RepID=A0A9P8AWS7_9AGAR|nr:uncharacterized protein BT62DRAFT_542723 [Guyanagaster necrorhizus MCA 3950]KAG7450888.1 hypothetical protein BT62DRAFT_542723 [Guyanagaster necrorhizus MCA 3950]
MTNDELARIIFSFIVIDVVGRGYQKTIEMLQAMSNAHAAPPHVRHLKIMSLSERRNVYAKEYVVFDLKPRHGCWTHTLPSDAFQQALKIALPNAIASLSHLKPLIMYACREDPQWALPIVINSAADHASLNNFPFPHQASRQISDRLSLNTLLSGIPDNISLRLRRLVLDAFDVTINDRLIKHFHFLTELRLGSTTSFITNDRGGIPISGLLFRPAQFVWRAF